ncbi:YhgE/Pip domain-containing protein [Parafrankia sp. EUN1f]|uniref:YhgE/Pip domain-containing protein n=1 Tax=Parafrankia sp. EUN1f TaxID=102897 RepID=UPI000316190C|nr:hypothetical protein [Parafrankia sp. EUN1f]
MHDLLRERAVWVLPLILASVVVSAMTALYLASAVDPLGHVRGLPVAVVNNDRGATLGAEHLDIGARIEAGLRASPEVSRRLRLEPVTLPEAEQAMSRGRAYATVVIPPGFTASLLAQAGLPAVGASGEAAAQARDRSVQLLTNPRAGTLGVSLASGVLQPAPAAASRTISAQLTAAAGATAGASTGAGTGSTHGAATTGAAPDGPVTDGPVTDGPVTDGPVTDGPATEGAGAGGAATQAFLANPVTVTISQFHPRPRTARSA